MQPEGEFKGPKFLWSFLFLFKIIVNGVNDKKNKDNYVVGVFQWVQSHSWFWFSEKTAV